MLETRTTFSISYALHIYLLDKEYSRQWESSEGSNNSVKSEANNSGHDYKGIYIKCIYQMHL